jgi:SAM-dependent methyltransferase
VKSFLMRVLSRLVGGHVERILQSPAIVNNPFLSAKIIPFERQDISDGHTYLVVGQPARDARGLDRIPVPPPELREGWWGSDADYLEPGRRDMATMLAILERAGASRAQFRRVLDFGCSAGRMLRFYPRPDDCECWGVDIKAKHIAWCQEHLSPPFLFTTTTTLPHLPFEDNYFDLVYCASVFTHIGDLPDSTLLELRRILRPEGLVYLTIHDEHSVNALFHRFQERGLTKMLQRLDAETGILQQGSRFFYVGTDPWTLVFYDSAYLVEKWSRFMEVESITPEAMDYQTALVLRKRSRSNAAELRDPT